MQVVSTAGHVDHGKSALLQRLTGMEPDRWAEERRRGLTIDLGYVWTELGGEDGAPVTVAFVDVPGHDSFLPNMLCGVGVVDRVLFVVAADDGWSPGSEEHLEILDLLERRCVAAVVTKSDVAGPGRTAEVVEDVRGRLASTSLRDAPVLAVDSLGGAGIDAVRDALAARLRRDVDDVPDIPDTDDGGRPARLWIDRAFTIRGAGTVVTGMLVSGRLETGQDIEVAPQGRTGRVRGLQCLEEPVEVATAGMRVAVNLAGIPHGAVGRGDALVEVRGTGGDAAGQAHTADVMLQALPHTGIGRRGAWHLHVGTAATTVRVLPLLDELGPGERGPVRLELARPLPLRGGDRFVLREAGRARTAGGGRVLDPAPGPRRRGTEQRLAHALVLDALASADGPSEQLRALVDAHDGVRARSQLRTIVGGSAVETVTGPDLLALGDAVVRRDLVDHWRACLLAAAGDAPAEQAIDTATLAAAVTTEGCPASLVPALVDQAVRDGRLHRHGGRLVHDDHERHYLDARAARRETLLAALRASPWEPPDPQLTATALGVPSFEVQELVDEGAVVACGPLLFTREAVDAAVERLRQGPGDGGAGFTASEARQAWDTSRRCAVPLLDHLRAIGVTGFDGEHHRFLRD